MTSVVVVFVLVTLLTLIGIGFTKVMNRSLQSSAANQQASAANYAAQSGINDVLSYLKTQPTTSSTKCDDLIKPGAPLAATAKITSDGNTAYTCVLVDPNPTSLFYQNLSPQKSQIVKITTSAQLASLLFSWQSPNRQHNQLVPAAQGQTLYDEKTWSNKNYAPLLRLTLYPVPVSGDLSNVQASSKTLFLYPQNGGGNSFAYNSSGDTVSVNCSSKNIGSFAGSADYDCNVVINNLPSAPYFYARFTSYYDQAVVKIKGNDGSGQPVKFKNVQAVVDVTAKSGAATKRLQARVDTSAATGSTDFNISAGSNNAPEFALGSTNTICKRLLVPPSTGSPVTIDPGSFSNCGLSLASSKPTVSLSASPSSGVASGGSSILTWTSTDATSCTASGDWSGNKPTNGSASTGPLSGPKTYTYTLTCDGPGGQGIGSATVTVNAPPAPPGGGGVGAPEVGSFVFRGPSGSSLSFTYSCNNSSSASITVNPNAHGGGVGTQPLGGTSGSATVGGPYQGGDSGTATLNCTNSTGTATRSQDWSISQSPVSVTIYNASTTYSNEFTRAYQTSVSPQESNDCRDGLHNYAICFSISASQGGDGSKIVNCTITTSGAGGGYSNTISNYSDRDTIRHSSMSGYWSNYQLGWTATPIYTFPSNNVSQPYDFTVLNVSCLGQGGVSGSASPRTAEWTTCADRWPNSDYAQGQYYSDVAHNNCTIYTTSGGGGTPPPGGGGTPPPVRTLLFYDCHFGRIYAHWSLPPEHVRTGFPCD